MRKIKENHDKSNVDKLIQGDNEIVEPKIIMEHITKFYQELYSKKERKENEKILDIPESKQLSEGDKEGLEKELTGAELFQALRNMKEGKAPGNDGLTVGLYKAIWPDIKDTFKEAVEEAIVEGELPTSMRQGVIRLIRKKGKDCTKIENWRPISLLNVDTKIISKALARRLEKILPKIIHPNQLAFVQKRLIYEGVRKTQYIIETAHKKQAKLAVMNIDFQKAFDSISHEYLWKALEKYNFGPNYIQMVQALYQKAESTVINNGTTGRYFPIGRSCRQGDCLSPGLFILAIEPLLEAIRKDRDIEGVKAPGQQKIKLSAFADDVTLYITNEEGIAKTREILQEFRETAGLQINGKKTEILTVGDWEANMTDYTTKHYITVTGIAIDRKGASMTELNETPIINKLQKLTDSWKQRGVSLKGRVMLMKTCGLSQLQYLASCMPIQTETMKKINKIIYRYIWKGVDRITRDRAAHSYQEGGLKLPQVEDIVTAASLQWIRYRKDEKQDWAAYLDDDIRKLGGYSALEGILDLDFEKLPMLSYNRLILQNMHKVQKTASGEITRVLNHPILYSKIIGIGKKRNYHDHARNLAKIGIYQVGQLLDEEGRLQMHEKVRKGGMSSSMAYAAVKNAIPTKWKSLIQKSQREIKQNKANQREKPDVQYQLEGEKGTISVDSRQKDILKWINSHKPNREPTFVKNMKQLYHITDEEWKQINIKAVSFTNYEKTKSFLYRLYNGLIYTNKDYKRFGIADSASCQWCQEEVQTLGHLFIECPKTAAIQDQTIQLYNEKMQTNRSFEERERLLTITRTGEKDLEWETILTTLNKYVWHNNNLKQEPTTHGFTAYLKQNYRTEKAIAYGNNSTQILLNFLQKWQNLMKVFEQ